MHSDLQRAYINHWKPWIKFIKENKSLDVKIIAEHKASIENCKKYGIEYELLTLIPESDSEMLYKLNEKGFRIFSNQYYRDRASGKYKLLSTHALNKKPPKAGAFKGKLFAYYGEYKKYFEERLAKSYTQLYEHFDVVIQFIGKSNKIPRMDNIPKLGDGVLFICVDLTYDKIIYGGVNIKKDMLEQIIKEESRYNDSCGKRWICS